MPVNSAGRVVPDTIDSILQNIANALRTQFGSNVDLTPTSPAVKFMQAFGGLPLAEAQMNLLDVQLQAYPGTATGQNLDNSLFTGLRIPASFATGNVNVTLTSGLNAPSPLFTAGSLVFLDAAGNKYRNTADVLPNGTTALVVPVQADVLGSKGNTAINGIINVTFTTGAASSRWATNVQSYTNTVAFTGGADKESDAAYLNRFRNSLASKPSSTPQGIATALLQTNGVLSADVLENTDSKSTADDLSFFDNSAHTGVNSETIDTVTKTRIAQKIIVPSGQKRFIQDFSLKLKTNTTAMTFTVQVETDSPGSPSGILYDANLVVTGYTPVSLNRTTGHFANGAFIDATAGAVTVWLVFYCTAGSGAVDGDNIGTALVKYYSSSAWSASAVVAGLDVQLIAGIPPHSFRAYVQGGAANDIAQAILNNKPLGVYADGNSVGNALGPTGLTVPMRYDTPTLTQLFINVTLNVTSSFAGNATTIKDRLIAYVGGTDSTAMLQKGLATGATFFINQARANLMDTDEIGGVQDVTVLQVATTASPTGTSNLAGVRGTKYNLLAANIAVTLVNV